MSTVVGHTAVRRALEADLPPVTLLRGPRSVGKTTLALYLAGYHRVLPGDLRQIDGTLLVDDVREIRRWSTRAGLGPHKIVIACLDGASLPAQHALLKLLEEPPPTVRFLLTSATPILATIASRCRVYPLGRLTAEEIAEILRRQGVPAGRAAAGASRADGRVDLALSRHQPDAARTTVLALVAAVAARDAQLLDEALTGADDAVRDGLEEWVCEAITRRFVAYTEAEMCDLHRDQALVRRILLALSQVRAARPRLGIRAALLPFVTR